MSASEASTRRALVLFSGGQDSATCVAWALERYDVVETLGFSYGQVHHIELSVRGEFRQRLAAMKPTWAQRLGEDHLVDAGVISQLAQSRLTGSAAEQLRNAHLPDTFVPGRNLIFLTLAAMLAYRRDIDTLVTGVCETDYSGYPDCRHATMQALEAALNLGMETKVSIQTPLMRITKAQTWTLANDLGGPSLVDAIRWQTHTCYVGDREHRHAWGLGCGHCDACRLRAVGWEQFFERSEDTSLQPA